MVQSTGIAEVMACTISAPQRGGRSPTIHTLPVIWGRKVDLVVQVRGVQGVAQSSLGGVEGCRGIVLAEGGVGAVGAIVLQSVGVGVGCRVAVNVTPSGVQIKETSSMFLRWTLPLQGLLKPGTFLTIITWGRLLIPGVC